MDTINQIFEREGAFRETGGNAPFLLDDRQKVWLVVSGQVDVFAVQAEAGQATGPRRYLFSATAGQILLGMNPDNRGMDLLAVGLAGTGLCSLPLERLQSLATQPDLNGEIATLLDTYFANIGQAVARYTHPQIQVLLKAGEQQEVDPGERAGTETPLWVKRESGEALFAGMAELSISPFEGYLPLSEGLWLEAAGELCLACVDTPTWLSLDPSWSGLTFLQEMFPSWIAHQIQLDDSAELERLERKEKTDQQLEATALTRLATLMEKETAQTDLADSADPLLAACRLIGQKAAITFQPPVGSAPEATKDPLRAICLASRVRFRQVVLQDGWWRTDSGPLLCYIESTGAPVAALPSRPGRYELVDPVDGNPVPVDAEVAATLQPFAIEFYRPFPEKALSMWELFRFGIQPLKRDNATVALAGVAAGILGMVTPLATGHLFSTVIPGADQFQLLELSVALVVVALTAAMFNLTRSFALLRIDGRSGASLQAAVWDRLLSLPLPFFRDYSVGDLTQRANAINMLRQALSGTAMTAIMGGMTSIFNFGLLFYYSTTLALVATAVLIVTVAITGVLAWLSLRYERHVQEVDGKIEGLVFQLIGGISKLRVAGTESRAFAVWGEQFGRKKQLAFRAGTMQNYTEAFNGVLPLISSMAIFGTVAYLGAGTDGRIMTGSFIAFSAAFTAFLTATIVLSTTLLSLLAVVPIVQRARPILTTLPEADSSRPDPGELMGRIEAAHLSFRYTEDGPLVLDDVSFHAEPGEFVAFVGPSGSGKSTTLRQLLGFETPESGSVYYDGQELASVDITAVRRQIGVVLQSGKLMPGDIFTNIVGSSLLGLDEAWEAARMAGLDEDIQQMPMGMQTVVSEGGATLSGGQRQRLLIARAIVAKPRILLFDEATSALDNRTQRIVSESLERLHATRIVVAHRLSTIRNADRIYVFDQGRIAQSGTFAELNTQEGLFARLVARQLT